MIDVMFLQYVWWDDHGVFAEKNSRLPAAPRVGELVLFDLIEESCGIESSEVECVQWQENGPIWIHLEDLTGRGKAEECRDEYARFGWNAHICQKHISKD